MLRDYRTCTHKKAAADAELIFAMTEARGIATDFPHGLFHDRVGTVLAKSIEIQHRKTALRERSGFPVIKLLLRKRLLSVTLRA
jgi:hypothetical protein